MTGLAELAKEIFLPKSQDIWQNPDEEACLVVYFRPNIEVQEIRDLIKGIGETASDEYFLKMNDAKESNAFWVEYVVDDNLEAQDEFLRRCEGQSKILCVIHTRYPEVGRFVHQIYLRRDGFVSDEMMQEATCRIKDNNVLVMDT